MSLPVPETLVRAIDLRYPSNRYAVGGAVAAALLGKISGHSWSASGRAGALAFLAWATARELDPDHPESASVALPVAALLALLEGERTPVQSASDLVGAGAALAGLRFTTGSVGAVPGETDDLALLGASALSALSGQRGAALLPALAPLAVRVSRREDVSNLLGSVLLRGTVALLPALRPAPGTGALGRVAALASLAFAAQTATPEGVEARTDQGTGRVSAERVQAARLMALGAAALAALEGRGSAAGLLAAVNLSTALRRAQR